MSVVDEIRARRGDPDDPFDQDAARRDYKRHATRKDRELSDAAKAGEQAGREGERARAKGSKRPSSKRRPAARARARSKKVYRQLGSPLRNQVSSFTQTFGLTLAVIALYQLLSSADQVSGALDKLGKGLEWLARPDTIVLPTK